jgi:leader peptidase (prepilin peptidase) / N-methyltransferase
MTSGASSLDALHAAASGAFILLLLWLSIVDLRSQRLPNLIVLPMLLGGLALNAFGLLTSPLDAVLGMIAGYGSLWTIGALYSFRRKAAFGGGDLKFAAAMGGWLGLSHLPVILLVAFVIGSCVSVPLVLLGRWRIDQRIPFGPALAAGGALALFGGPSLWSVLYPA